MLMRFVLAMLLFASALPAAAFGSQEPIGEPQTSEQPPAEEPPRSVPPERPSGVLQQSPLDTFYMRDKDGNLVPVLGMPFEEFEQLLRLRRGLGPAPPPAYVLQSLTLVGKVQEDAATFELKAAIIVREAGWVRVPLELQSAVLREEARYDGPGESLMTFDANDGGYVCWLKGQSDQPHTVILRIGARIGRLGDEQKLALRLPRATESLLNLAIPGGPITGTLAAGEGILATQRSGEGAMLQVLGAAGDLALQWRQRSESIAASRQLEVSGEITVRIESQHRITSEARLRVRGSSGVLERFTVSLPPGMELAPMPPVVGYTLTPLVDAGNNTSQRVEVRLDTQSSMTNEVFLRAQLSSDGTARTILPAQFVVADAMRQRGAIDFVSQGELQLNWSGDASVHRVDVSPEQAAAGVIARYEYFRQPCELLLEVVPRPARLSVEPTHLAHVDARNVRLETMLKCRFRGARPEGLTVNLEGWTFERLTPDTWFDVPVMNDQGQAFFPIRPGATLPPEIELKLETHRRTADDSQRLEFGFPRVMASNVTPATVVVFAADNIELTPQPSELVGLSADATPVRVPGRQQAPLVYRDLGGG